MQRCPSSVRVSQVIGLREYSKPMNVMRGERPRS